MIAKWWQIKEENPGQPVAYPPLHGHRGSVYINRSYEKAEAREDPAHKEMIVIDYSGGGEEREARSPVQVVDLTSREEVKTHIKPRIKTSPHLHCFPSKVWKGSTASWEEDQSFD